MVLIGRDAATIRAALGPRIESITADSLPQAVRRAAEEARPGDAVLLSPACASFDMFRDYQDRGRQFKSAVQSLPE